MIEKNKTKKQPPPPPPPIKKKKKKKKKKSPTECLAYTGSNILSFVVSYSPINMQSVSQA